MKTRLLVLMLGGVAASLATGGAGLLGVTQANHLAEQQQEMNQSLRYHLEGDMMHDALRADVLSALLASNEAGHDEAQNELTEHAKWFRTCLEGQRGLNLPAQVRSALDEVEQPLEAYIKAAEMIVSKARHSRQEAESHLPAFISEFEHLEGAMEALSDKLSARAEELRAEQQSAGARILWMIATLAVATAVLLGVVSYFTARSLTSRLKSAVDTLSLVAKGNLTVRAPVEGQDEVAELARACNSTVESLSGIVCDFYWSAKTVSESADAIKMASQRISTCVQDQTAQTAAVGKALDRVTEAADQVAQRSATASDSATKSGHTAATGGQSIERTLEEMREISSAVQGASSLVQELGKRGEQIGQMVGVINDIADQTNLLALNAAIEAARAGEHGRGFAVVADEVRKLADRTTKATEEIGESIKAIRDNTEAAVEQISVGAKRASRGVESAAEMGQTLRSIVSGVSNVAEVISTMTAETHHQRDAARDAVERLKGVAESVHAAAQEARSSMDAAEKLNQNSARLLERLAKLDLERREIDKGPPGQIAERRAPRQELATSGRR
ncbi:MAG: methyl-accepting chemotaxis protein [Planctomycetota bacterium]|nr:methyl-accepting chemotaxis protein [Planctomycetota bacterium]